MESRILENSKALWPQEAIEIIKNIFDMYFPDYKTKQVFDWGGFYGFGVIIEKNDVEIMFGGGRGFFDHSITIGNKQYSLRDFDDLMKLVGSASEKNYRYAVIVLARLLENLGR